MIMMMGIIIIGTYENKTRKSQKETKEAQMSSHSRLLSFSPVQFGVVKPTRDGLCLSELSQVQKLK